MDKQTKSERKNEISTQRNILTSKKRVIKNESLKDGKTERRKERKKERKKEKRERGAFD